MMNKTEIYGYSVIAVLLPVLIFLVFILWKMYHNWFFYGRQIPKPPHPYKPCLHGFAISEVMNLGIDPRCENCGEKLSELRESIKLKN
jgi:hypothetical protein